MSDIRAYEILVREHENMLGAYVRGIVGDAAMAQDIAQEAFLRAYKNLSTFEEGTSFGAWIRTIARNLALDEMRRRRRELSWDPDLIEGIEDVLQPLDDPSKGETWAERLTALEGCYGALPEMLREPCRLYYFEEYPSQRIADTLQIKLEAVRKRLERARSMIKECFEKALRLENV